MVIVELATHDAHPWAYRFFECGLAEGDTSEGTRVRTDYLSTALLFASRARFLVLDDVTSTFDGGHQWHLMELLRNHVSPPNKPDGLQVILLTHDSLLQKYLDKQSQDPSWKHYRLTGTPPKGNVVTSVEDASRIKKRADKYLSSGQWSVPQRVTTA